MTKLARKTIKTFGNIVGMEHQNDGTTIYFKLTYEDKQNFNIDTLPLNHLSDYEILNELYDFTRS